MNSTWLPPPPEKQNFQSSPAAPAIKQVNQPTPHAPRGYRMQRRLAPHGQFSPHNRLHGGADYP